MVHAISYDAILRATAAVANVRMEELTGLSRDRVAAWPRQRAFFLARRIRPDLSFPNIGRRTGGRDHSTALYGAREAERRYQTNEADEVAIVDATLRLLGLDELPADPIRPQRHRAAVTLELTRARRRVATLEAELAAIPEDA